MSADKHQPVEHSAESHAEATGEKVVSGAAITDKADNKTRQRLETREALKVHRLTRDKSNAFGIDMGGGRTVEDKRPLTESAQQESSPTSNHDAPSATISPANAKAHITDYPTERVNRTTFSLGLDYEDKSSVRSPADKIQDFSAAALKHAADPQEWKAWVNGEVEKFHGIGVGLNEAKEETKSAVAAGLKAVTDGTVVSFLSNPDAINAPLFKTVANVFDAMAKDPEAVNKSLESLGKVILKASEGYSNLSDYEKGKVIGKAMFAMVNPEGDPAAAANVIEVGSRATQPLTQAVRTTIEDTLASIQLAAKSSPEIANESKQFLLEYIERNGLSPKALEKSGEIPEGYFDHLAGKGGGWDVLNERESADVVKQITENSCASACGEMLTNGAIKQEHLIEELRQYWPEHMRVGDKPADLQWLAKELGPEWQGGLVNKFDTKEENLDWLVGRQQSFCVELKESGKVAHAVVVDGVDASGNICVRDPYSKSKYEMTRKEFCEYWNCRVVCRK